MAMYHIGDIMCIWWNYILIFFVEGAKISLWDMLSPYSFPTSFHPCSKNNKLQPQTWIKGLASVCVGHGLDLTREELYVVVFFFWLISGEEKKHRLPVVFGSGNQWINHPLTHHPSKIRV